MKAKNGIFNKSRAIALPEAVARMNDFALENAISGNRVPEENLFLEYACRLHIDCNMRDLRKNLAGEWLNAYGKLRVAEEETYCRAFYDRRIEKIPLQFSTEYAESLYRVFREVLAMANAMCKEGKAKELADYNVNTVILFLQNIQNGKFTVGDKLPIQLFLMSATADIAESLCDESGGVQTTDTEALEYKLLVLLTFRFYDRAFAQRFAKAIAMRLYTE